MKKSSYYPLIVVVTFVALIVSAGVRTTPSVIMTSLEQDFGWTRASISFAVAISLFAFGFGGPLGGTLIDRFGPRRVMLGGLALIALGLAPLVALDNLWQLHLLWGLVIGIGTGAISGTLGATVALRWFTKYRGMVVGIFGAAAAAGQLVFVPLLLALSTSIGWRAVIGFLALLVAFVLVPSGDFHAQPSAGCGAGTVRRRGGRHCQRCKACADG
ncbi:MAG: MFS transporter [bacterium]|nr:MFS transporter [bacterium]